MFFLKELPTQDMLARYADRYPNMDIEKTRSTLNQLRQASLCIRAIENYFAKHDLSFTRFLILIILEREPDKEKYTMMDLVKRMDISKAVMSNALKTLHKSNFITIGDSEKDGRAKVIEITKIGHEKRHSVIASWRDITTSSITMEKANDT